VQRTCPWLLLVVLALLLTYGLAQANLYPDPSFESSGNSNVARTGQKSLYLKVEAKNHWACVGGALAVEPFAKYRVTEWVKGNIGKGAFFAPYCYQWNNYVWRFSNSNTIKTLKDWTQVSMTFISPHPTMNLHPLAYIDAENCEAWVDDIVVEKIAEPAQAMAELAAEKNPGPDAIETLARWYVAQGNLAEVDRLLKSAPERLTRADLACLLAQNTPDLSQRRPYVVTMVASAALVYNDGKRRFDEVTVGYTPAQRLDIATDAVRLSPQDAEVVRCYRMIVETNSPTADALLTSHEAVDAIGETRDAVKRLTSIVPANSAAAREVATTMASLDKSYADAQKALDTLGKCVVSIGGKPLAPSTHAIVIPDGATAQEYRAAMDLRRHLELITGAVLPVWYEHSLGDRTPILVGNCKLTRQLAPSVDLPSLGLEGIHLKTVGPALILAGNQRGVLYAVYTLLEDYLNCRWFAPGCSKWPTSGTFALAGIDKRFIPQLEYRGTDYPSSRDADWAVRNKYNGQSHNTGFERGGNIRYRGFVHTFKYLVPPEIYYAEHPEYYSEIKGKRIPPDRTQLCLTNPDVLRIATQTVRRWIAESPDASIISVSQNDWHNYCECANCRKVAEEEGSESGSLVRFVNAIADNIKDDYPNVAIDTLAYQYTRKPPKITRPRPNVIIRLCSIECCFIHPLESDPYNATFVDDIRGWNQKCNRLHIWDYVINYAHSICPFPNLYVIKPNINFFINNGVKGIYEEACYYTKGSEMQELRSYLMAKTLWDPSYDTDKAIDEFCDGFWGPAGRYIRQYINLVHEHVQKDPNLHVRIYTHPKQFLTPELIGQCRVLFDKAEAAVKDDPTLLHRVQVARLPIIYTEITLASAGAFAQRGDQLVQEGGTDVTGLAKRFEEIARAEGVTRVREGGTANDVDGWLATIPKRATTYEIKTLRNDLLEVSVIPGLGGRIWRVRSLPGNQDMIYLAGSPEAYDPTTGGYEEFSEGDYRTPGWNEPYKVIAQSANSLTLQATFSNGLQITRRLELVPDSATLKIASTVTNTTSTTRKAALRCHPEFAVATTGKARVQVALANGTMQDYDLANTEDPKAEKELWFRATDVPAGTWRILDLDRGMVITDRFKSAQVSQALLNWNGAQSRVNLELFAPSVNLNAGQSQTLEHEYEFQRLNK
jgi:hypothetical protein